METIKQKMPSGEDKSDFVKVVKQFLGEISTKSLTVQIASGSVSGWITGYATMKIGKMTAILIGGSIIILNVAHQQGFIQIDWSKITRTIDAAESEVRALQGSNLPATWAGKVKRTVLDNTIFFTSFIGGVFLGFGCA